MSRSTRIVLAAGGGYLLGRTKKLRFALMIGGAVTGRTFPTSATDLVRIGVRYAASAPELARLRSAVRHGLLVAGGQAFIAAAGHQMEALTERMTSQLEVLEVATASDSTATREIEPSTDTLLSPVEPTDTGPSGAEAPSMVNGNAAIPVGGPAGSSDSASEAGITTVEGVPA